MEDENGQEKYDAILEQVRANPGQTVEEGGRSRGSGVQGRWGMSVHLGEKPMRNDPWSPTGRAEDDIKGITHLGTSARWMGELVKAHEGGRVSKKKHCLAQLVAAHRWIEMLTAELEPKRVEVYRLQAEARALHISLARATDAFAESDIAALSTVNETLQPLVDAAVVWGRRDIEPPEKPFAKWLVMVGKPAFGNWIVIDGTGTSGIPGVFRTAVSHWSRRHVDKHAPERGMWELSFNTSGEIINSVRVGDLPKLATEQDQPVKPAAKWIVAIEDRGWIFHSASMTILRAFGTPTITPDSSVVWEMLEASVNDWSQSPRPKGWWELSFDGNGNIIYAIKLLALFGGPLLGIEDVTEWAVGGDE